MLPCTLWGLGSDKAGSNRPITSTFARSAQGLGSGQHWVNWKCTGVHSAGGGGKSLSLKDMNVCVTPAVFESRAISSAACMPMVSPHSPVCVSVPKMRNYTFILGFKKKCAGAHSSGLGFYATPSFTPGRFCLIGSKEFWQLLTAGAPIPPGDPVVKRGGGANFLKCTIMRVLTAFCCVVCYFWNGVGVRQKFGG